MPILMQHNLLIVVSFNLVTTVGVLDLFAYKKCNFIDPTADQGC